MRRILKKVLHSFNLDIRKDPQSLSEDMDSSFGPIWRKTREYTMTSVERMYALYKATEYIATNQVPGDIVECGVWRGGSSMLCAYTLKKYNSVKRNIYLYDTFSGMAKPGKEDKTVLGNASAQPIWENSQKGDINKWCYASYDEVRTNFARTGYPLRKVHFVKGKVEETIPKTMPKRIALLRLDTDWFKSTRHELQHLYPQLVRGGFLIIDDYGHWTGAKKAVDEYFKKRHIRIFLNRIDYSGRIAIK